MAEKTTRRTWFESMRPADMLADVPSVKAGRRQNAIDQPERCKQSGKPIRSAAGRRSPTGLREPENLRHLRHGSATGRRGRLKSGKVRVQIPLVPPGGMMPCFLLSLAARKDGQPPRVHDRRTDQMCEEFRSSRRTYGLDSRECKVQHHISRGGFIWGSSATEARRGSARR